MPHFHYYHNDIVDYARFSYSSMEVFSCSWCIWCMFTYEVTLL